MQEKINRFNAAFLDLAAAYVDRLRCKVVQQSTITTEAPEARGLTWIGRDTLADEVRVTNVLAATICKMQKAQGAELLADCPADVEREPVTLGPGVYFRLENTSVSGPPTMRDGVNVDVLPVLKNLCGYCRALAKSGGAVPPEREWATDAAALEIAISVLSELQEIREVRISAEPEAGKPFDLEDVIRKTVAETFNAWTATAKDGGCIVITEEEAAQDGPGEKEGG